MTNIHREIQNALTLAALWPEILPIRIAYRHPERGLEYREIHTAQLIFDTSNYHGHVPDSEFQVPVWTLRGYAFDRGEDMRDFLVSRIVEVEAVGVPK